MDWEWKPRPDQVRPEDLAGETAELAEVIGLPAVLALVVWRGGCELGIPRHRIERHAIARAIGREPALRLAAIYGGTRIALPTLTRLCLPARNRALIEAHAAGAPIDALARRFGCTMRTVRSILREARHEPPATPQGGAR